MSKLVREARGALIDSTRNADFLSKRTTCRRAGRVPIFLTLLLAARRRAHVEAIFRSGTAPAFVPAEEREKARARRDRRRKSRSLALKRREFADQTRVFSSLVGRY